MNTQKSRLTGATTTGRPVFYRSAVREFLKGRLPQATDVDLLADEILRDVCDPEVLGLFLRDLGTFRETLLSVILLRLRLLHSEESPLSDEQWPVAPASDEQRSRFDALYASALVAAAAEGFSRGTDGRAPRLALVFRLRYREGLPIARVAERAGIGQDAVACILLRGQKGFRRALLDSLRLACATEEEAVVELRYLVLLLAGRAEVQAGWLAQEALGWLRGVVRALREVEGGYIEAGGSVGDIHQYVRAKLHAVGELCRRLLAASRAGLPAVIAVLSEYEAEPWLEEEYGTDTFRLVCGKIDRLRAALIACLRSGAPLPDPASVA